MLEHDPHQVDHPLTCDRSDGVGSGEQALGNCSCAAVCPIHAPGGLEEEVRMSEQPVVTGDVATPVVSGAGIRGVGLTPEEKAVFVELMVKYTLDQGLEADREDLSSLNSVSRARARGRTAVRRYDHLTSHWADD